MTPQLAQPPRTRSRRRAIVFRLAAVLLGLVPLVAIETLCRLAGWGIPANSNDPFVGFSATRPLFTLSDDGQRYEIAPGKRTWFEADSFAAHKPSNEFRIFCLGGSTVQGRPYSIDTSFTTWLQLSLQAADPKRQWRAVNCGGVSYATYRLAPLLEEVLNYEPDLVIFYEGHNEFLEDRTYREIKHAPRWFTVVHESAAQWHTYNLIRSAMAGQAKNEAQKPETVLAPEVDARLDWRRGMEAYHRDPQWQRDCIEHFEFNLRRIVALARARRVPLVLVNPASNLDWPPFKAEPREGLSQAEQNKVQELRSRAGKLYGDNPAEALQSLKQAAAIDDQHAGLQFDLGKCYQKLGLLPQARETLVRAKDLDICPLRALAPMNQIVLQVAGETKTVLVDADALFASHSPGGINGPEWFVDHVHPTIDGHQLLADALADELARQGFVQPVADWQPKRQLLYERHLARLPANYFPEGARRLTNEQGWAHGRSKRVKTADR